MSIIRQSLALAFTLTVAGAAFARNPPALARAQQADERLGPGSGYRGALALRTGDVTGHAAAGYRDSNSRFSAAIRVGATLAFTASENQAVCPAPEPSRC
jgi:hypothetical protein